MIKLVRFKGSFGMVFSSTIFLFIFLPVTLILYYLPIHGKKTREYRNYILVFCSLAFYAWGEPLFVIVMVAYIVMNWLLALKIEKSEDASRRKSFLIIALFADVLLIIIAKYIPPIIREYSSYFFNLEIPSTRVPIGISFFTFQLISYMVDVYRKNAKPQKKLSDLVMYISLFPQLVAGPIVRYSYIANEINERVESKKLYVDGFEDFVKGLAKKVLLANYLGLLADFAFDNIETLSIGYAWYGAIAYSLQIYFDFSGYSDMAIGLGKMFGFHFPKNFNFPYIASSITDFWRRWHITLSEWFRDYVYIPLGGNKCGKGKMFRNLLVVWILTGMWHGANWTFIMWGLMYFLLLVFEKQFEIYKLNNVFTHMYTLFFVMIGWVIFRSESFGKAVRYMQTLFGMNGSALIDGGALRIIAGSWLLMLVSIICSIPIRKNLHSGVALLLSKIKELFLIIIFLISIICCVQQVYNPFIYLNF